MMEALPANSVGEFVPHKWIWLLDRVEVVGTVTNIGAPPEGAPFGDDIDIAPDPSYTHLVSRLRGNAPLPWRPLGTPRALHLETYPLQPGDIARMEQWDLPKKPEDQPFMVRLPDHSRRPLAVGDRVRVVGWWNLDHHPEYCKDPIAMFGEPTRCLFFAALLPVSSVLCVGQSHAELHPFDWQNIELVAPVGSADTAEGTLSLAAPLYEQVFVGTGKWLFNGPLGGRVFRQPAGVVDGGYENFHPRVTAGFFLQAPPRPSQPAYLHHEEQVMRLGAGLHLEGVRRIEVRQGDQPGVSVTATIDAGPDASILDPAHDRSVFQARYEARWDAVQADWRYCNTCQGMYFGGGWRASVCPKGGTHADPSTSGDYLLFHDVPSSPQRQDNWRWCNKCQGLYFGGGWQASLCPASGRHADPSSSGNYSLLHAVAARPDLQDDWRWCNKCQGLHFGGGWRTSVCPRGGTHADPNTSGNYSLVHKRRTPPSSGRLKAMVSPDRIGEGTHSVRVLANDAGTGAPVAGRVFLGGNDWGPTNTVKRGPWDPGTYTFTARCAGYPDTSAVLRVARLRRPPDR